MSREEIMTTLRAFPGRLRTATAGLDPATAAKRPASGDWSVTVLVCHLRDYAELFNGRLVIGLSEDSPAIRAYDNADLETRHEYVKQDLRQVQAAAIALTEYLTAFAARFSDSAWRRTVQHPAWGQVSLEFLVDRCGKHGLEHLEQIAKVRADVEGKG